MLCHPTHRRPLTASPQLLASPERLNLLHVAARWHSHLVLLSGLVRGRSLVVGAEYTTDEDFDMGTSINVNHNATDQLELDSKCKSSAVICLVCLLRTYLTISH